MELLSHEKSLLLETVKIRITAAKDMLSGLNAAKDSCFSIKLKYDLVQLESLAKKLQEEDKRDIEQLILQDERDMNALFGEREGVKCP